MLLFPSPNRPANNSQASWCSGGCAILKRLDLRYNHFRRFPRALLDLPFFKPDLAFGGKQPRSRDKVVFLQGNPIEDVPYEVMQQGMTAIRSYLKD